jgi:small subunit ribosomal protein S2
MKPYIYGAWNNIHIIDLLKTAELLKVAFNFVVESVSAGGHVLFVGSKRQAQEIILEEAKRCNMFYVTNRWIGGTLTNFRTIQGTLERLKTLEKMVEDESIKRFPKKEQMRLEKERRRLEKYLGGIKDMNELPSVVYIVDPVKEEIAVQEALRLKIPTVAITDTNCDPNLISYIIPGNDDGIRGIKLITSYIADACLAGQKNRREYLAQITKKEKPEQPTALKGLKVEYVSRRGK